MSQKPLQCFHSNYDIRFILYIIHIFMYMIIYILFTYFITSPNAFNVVLVTINIDILVFSKEKKGDFLRKILYSVIYIFSYQYFVNQSVMMFYLHVYIAGCLPIFNLPALFMFIIRSTVHCSVGLVSIPSHMNISIDAHFQFKITSKRFWL